MSRLPPRYLRTTVLRWHCVLAACAAVLLTSFADEALQAISVARSGDSAQAAPSPDQSDELSLFPDLSPSRSDRGGIGSIPDIASSTLDSIGVEDLPVPVAGRVASIGESRIGCRSVNTLHCVWQI